MENLRMKILYSRDEIERVVRDMAERISRDYEGKDLVVVCVLKGAFMFMADLVRHLKVPCVIDFMRLASYGSGTATSGKVLVTKDLETPIAGKDVLIVEDIVDTGITLQYLTGYLENRKPKSIKICALLDKPARRKADVYGDYVGFTVEDKFIVGYGLDFNQKYRQLPYISCLAED